MRYISFLFFCFILASCNRYNPGEEIKLSPVAFSYSESSEVFNQNNVTLQLDTGANILYITLKCRLHKGTKYPIEKKYNDTLTETGFRFDFLADGKPILSGFKGRGTQSGDGRFTNMGNDEAVMWLRTDTFNLKNETNITLQIPFYAFYKLKKGVHDFEIKVSQTVFRSNQETKIPFYDSTFKRQSYNYVRFRAESSFINCKAKFKLNIPVLHKTILYSNKIEIKNDSTFNPYTSDNTIWRSPLPDVYWAVYYPKNDYYTSSDYETSTIEYTKRDTFNLFHYGLNDSLCFGVWDHDNLSRDDGLGFKNFCIKDVLKENGVNSTFHNVKLFSVRAVYKGKVNP